MIKLLALDLDGTLLNDNQTIDKETVKSLKKIKNSGIKIVLCSSRPYYRIKKFVKQLDLDCPNQYTVSFNGGLILENNSNNIVFINTLKIDEVKEIIKMGRNSNLRIFLYEESNIISNLECLEYTENNPDSNFEIRDFNDLNLEKHVIYKIIFYGEKNDILKLKKEIPEYIREKFMVTSSHDSNIEIVPKDNSKSKGLAKIGKITGISAEEMACFGDNENDLDMFNYVGYSIAMGNAIDNIKDIANYVTFSNNENGIVHAIEDMINKNMF